jgi:hypothetical protein
MAMDSSTSDAMNNASGIVIDVFPSLGKPDRGADVHYYCPVLFLYFLTLALIPIACAVAIRVLRKRECISPTTEEVVLDTIHRHATHNRHLLTPMVQSRAMPRV